MPRFYETTLSITNLHNLSISTHVNRSRMITITNPYFTRMKNGITSNNSYSLIVGLSVSMMGMMMSMRRCKCRV